jgi:hypothetical protein
VKKTYGDLAHFGILSRLLYSTDQRVVAMAAQVLSTTVNTQSTSSQDGSHQPASVPIPSNSFKTFLPALRRLAQSENSAIAAQAQALLQNIEALLTA